jgi:ABC-type multidrug transport system ATPase subunit
MAVRRFVLTSWTNDASARPPALALRGVTRAYGEKLALRDVSLSVAPGEIHALLGPNGSGKTTLIRTLAGLLTPTSGEVSVLSLDASQASQRLRQLVGFVPSGDRSFYLRISGLENLVFFGRLHGLRRREAVARANELLERVELADVADTRVAFYSHGMQKRLSVARAFLTDPPILLVDEATHDLDPGGAREVRALASEAAARGAAVVWATQRIDEIGGFGHRATVLAGGRVTFSGTVSELVARADSTRYLLRLRNGGLEGEDLVPVLERAIGSLGSVEMAADEFVLALGDRTVLGEALVRLAEEGVQILSCHPERSALEEAFVAVAGGR